LAVSVISSEDLSTPSHLYKPLNHRHDKYLVTRKERNRSSVEALNFSNKMWPKTQSNHLHKKPFVQEAGIDNDHVVDCFRYEQVKTLSQ
jgi:hypothetical protein